MNEYMRAMTEAKFNWGFGMDAGDDWLLSFVVCMGVPCLSYSRGSGIRLGLLNSDCLMVENGKSRGHWHHTWGYTAWNYRPRVRTLHTP